VIPHPAGHPVGPEQVVLDQNDLLKRHPYVCVGTVKLSEDHALMAYTIDTTGDETYSAGEECQSTIASVLDGVEQQPRAMLSLTLEEVM
jgi:protease II